MPGVVKDTINGFTHTYSLPLQEWDATPSIHKYTNIIDLKIVSSCEKKLTTPLQNL